MVVLFRCYSLLYLWLPSFCVLLGGEHKLTKRTEGTWHEDGLKVSRLSAWWGCRRVKTVLCEEGFQKLSSRKAVFIVQKCSKQVWDANFKFVQRKVKTSLICLVWRLTAKAFSNWPLFCSLKNVELTSSPLHPTVFWTTSLSRPLHYSLFKTNLNTNEYWTCPHAKFF